jgi:hypothetical protein
VVQRRPRRPARLGGAAALCVNWAGLLTHRTPAFSSHMHLTPTHRNTTKRKRQDGLAERLGALGTPVPRRVREAPFVQIPLGVTEDRLVGTVDIEASIKVGDAGGMCFGACDLCVLCVVDAGVMCIVKTYRQADEVD